MKTNTAFLAAVVWAALIHAKNLGNLLFQKDSELHRASALEDQVVSPAARALTAMGSNNSSNIYDPTFDGFNTPSVKCRLQMEQFQNDNIDHWLLRNKEFPLIEWIWELQDEATGERYYNGLFHVLLCGKGKCSPDRARQIAHYDWTWQDQFGASHKMNKIDLYDLDFEPRIHFRMVPPSNTNKDPLVPKSLVAVKPGSGPFVYDLQPYLNCNRIEKAHPPPRQPKIGACIARFLGQHDLMPEWIAYHRLLGIEHFFVFISEPFESIYKDMPRHETDITYIPYNFTWAAHQHNGDDSMVTAVSGFHAHGENWFQSYANNQCLYMAKQHELDWVIAPDVDEYIVLNDPDITHFGEVSPLQQFFDKHNSVVSEPDKCNGDRKRKAIRKAREMKKQKIFRRRRLSEEQDIQEAKEIIKTEQRVNEDKVKGSKKQQPTKLLEKQQSRLKGTSRRRLAEQDNNNKPNKHDIPGETEAERRARKRERFRQWHREREEKQARKRAAAAVAAEAALKENQQTPEERQKEQEKRQKEQEEQERRQKEQEEQEKWRLKLEEQELYKQQEKERTEGMQQRREQLSQQNNDNPQDSSTPKFDSVGNIINDDKDSVDVDMDNYDGPILQICLYGASYGKHPEKERDDQYQLSLDFTHRINKKIDGSGECRDDGHGAGGRRKCFYNAKLVEDVHVHGMKDDEPYFRGTSHARVDEIELFHFRSPLLGPRHTHNWKEEPVAVEDLVSYPRTRDMYKEKVLAELRKNNWPLPNFGKHRCSGYNC